MEETGLPWLIGGSALDLTLDLCDCARQQDGQDKLRRVTIFAREEFAHRLRAARHNGRR